MHVALETSIISLAYRPYLFPCNGHKRQMAVVVLCGLPGSGKSTLAQALAADLGLVRVCQDVLGTRQHCEDTVYVLNNGCRPRLVAPHPFARRRARCLAAGQGVVIDRCNISVAQARCCLAGRTPLT